MSSEKRLSISSLDEGSMRYQWLRYPCTVVHIIIFALNLLLFHPILLVARVFGEKALDWVMNYHCLIHLMNIRLTGARYTIKKSKQITTDKPLILVANHQAMYDIPLIIWNLRSRRPKFISKKELQFYIPSISFALRHGGHLIIDRSNGRTAISRIREFGITEAARCGAICIFPEGTRSPKGPMRQFKIAGVATLLDAMPEAQVIPVTLDGTGHVVGKKILPLGLGARILLQFHDPLSREGKSHQELLSEAENIVRTRIEQWRMPG